MYVPLLETLQNMLNNEAILAEVKSQYTCYCVTCYCTQQIMTGHTSELGTLEDYCDGKAFKSHPLFSSNQQSFQINLYYDDVEVCNPLGSKAKIHKLGKKNINVLLECNNCWLFRYFLLHAW